MGPGVAGFHTLQNHSRASFVAAAETALRRVCVVGTLRPHPRFQSVAHDR